MSRGSVGIAGCLAAVGVSAVAVVAGLVLTPATAQTAVSSSVLPGSDPVDHTPDILDAQARAMATVGDRIVVGGTFTTVRDYDSTHPIHQRSLFAFDRSTGLVDQSFRPAINGDVNAVLAHPDGTKVWVAGSFTAVNGAAHSRIALLDVRSGEVVSAFDPPPISAAITSIRLANGQLYIGGQFATIGGRSRRALATLDPRTGALTDHMQSRIRGTLDGVGVPSIKSFDLSADGRRLVAIGNFDQVDGQHRSQLAVWNTAKPTATLRTWGTRRYRSLCNPVFPTYMRDVDIAPNGRFFVVVTTGSYRYRTLCDTAARWDLEGNGLRRQPRWVAYTGGDTFTAVEVTGPMAYVGGHFRWLNNPYRGEAAGSGAWPTSGLAVLDTRNGLPFDWHPRRVRGLGIFDFLVTADDVWSVSDSSYLDTQKRQRLAAYPIDGSALPPDALGALPGEVWQLGGVAGATSGAQRAIGFDGTKVTRRTTQPGAQDWTTVRGAFAVDGTVYAAWRDHTFTVQSWDGASFGTPRVIDLNAGTSGTPGYTHNFINDLATITGIFYDPARARIYYAMKGDAHLYWRAFTPESGVVGATRTTVTRVGDLQPRRIRGMFLTHRRLYFADSATGALRRVTFRSGEISGPVTTVNAGLDWRANALFLSSREARLDARSVATSQR